QLLGIVAQDVQRLDRLITDISRATRLEAETARGDLGRVDLGELVYELTRAYEPPEDARGRVEVLFRGAKPQGLIMLGQGGPLRQVFRNLIDNARSFSPEGGHVYVSAEIVRTKDGPAIRVTVDDEGPGIPEENLETIFRRFYTQRPAGAAFGGNSGLGLSIARQIVGAHRGRIYAQNIVRAGPLASGGGSSGARLVVELPLSVPSRA